MNRKARRAARHAGGSAAAVASHPTELPPANRFVAAATYYNEGNRHRLSGRLAEAMESYLKAIESAPDFMDAHFNFCAVLVAQSRFAEAATHCEQILAHDPTLVSGHIHLAVARICMGDFEGALNATRNALATSETPEGRMMFANCLQSIPSIPDDGGMRELLFRAMSEPWGRPGEFARHCVSLIKADKEIAACIDRAVAAWPERPPADVLFGASGLQTISRDKIFRCLLENARIADFGLERLLTAARSALLDAASAETELDNETCGFYCALARQCFVNEYVYAFSDEELQRAERLRGALEEKLHDDAPVSPLLPVAVAAYSPLYTLEHSEKLLERSWPDAVDGVLTQQIREPNEEIRLRPRIRQLTPIEDEVSLLVQRQYEENPYPRWVKVAPLGMPSDINARLRGLFPHASFYDIGAADTVDVLLAGCGTGQQVIDVAARIIGARVLAIDLSLPSLCYAKRQSDALGLRNVKYGQADILKLDALDRKFHVIDCAGVLHHLGDPIVGWRVLLSKLRPNGVMRVALYSELARRNVVAGRNFVAEHEYGSSPDDIRRFRQEVFGLPGNDPVKKVTKSHDFFSISDCRDLIFHVQEHRFMLPQIEVFLAANNLTFLGFEEMQSTLNRYSARFPEDRARTNLKLWHQFEQENPWIFGRMYQFWVQKADGSQ